MKFVSLFVLCVVCVSSCVVCVSSFVVCVLVYV